MQVQLGNPAPSNGGPATVTYVSLDDSLPVADSIDVGAVLSQLFRSNVTNLPGCDALLSIIAPTGVWKTHSFADAPTWVWSDNAKLQDQLCAVYACPAGSPVPLENN